MLAGMDSRAHMIWAWLDVWSRAELAHQFFPHWLRQPSQLASCPSRGKWRFGRRERLEDGSMVQDTAWRERDSWAAPRSVTACLPVGPQALSILYQDIWHNRVTRRPRAKQWGKKPLTRSLTALKKVKVWNKTTKTKSSISRAKYHFVFTGGGVSRESWAQGLLVDYHNITSEAASFLPVFMRAEPRPVQQGQRSVNL